MSKLKQVQFEIQTVLNWETAREPCFAALHHAATLKIPHLPQLLEHTGKCAIVGAGPSVAGFYDSIVKVSEPELNILMSINGAHDWLIKQGKLPNIHVIFEPDIDDVTISLGGPPHKDVVYYVCSHCSPKVFQQLEGYHQVLWHCLLPPHDYQHLIARLFPNEFMVSGGFATFFRCLNIAIILGYRDFELFGLDSSFSENSHMDGYAIANREEKVAVWGTDPSKGERKEFTTQGGLAFQASQFVDFCAANQSALKMRVHGDGLLRYLHESRYPEQYQTDKETRHDGH